MSKNRLRITKAKNFATAFRDLLDEFIDYLEEELVDAPQEEPGAKPKKKAAKKKAAKKKAAKSEPEETEVASDAKVTEHDDWAKLRASFKLVVRSLGASTVKDKLRATFDVERLGEIPLSRFPEAMEIFGDED